MTLPEKAGRVCLFDGWLIIIITTTTTIIIITIAATTIIINLSYTAQFNTNGIITRLYIAI